MEQGQRFKNCHNFSSIYSLGRFVLRYLALHGEVTKQIEQLNCLYGITVSDGRRGTELWERC